MAIKVISRPDFESLVSPGPDKQAPIYNWHSFKHSYSKKLVHNLIDEFALKKGSWVLDPFCGGGTTLLSCKQAGVNSHGFDILPFSVFLSNAKVQKYDESSLLRDIQRFRAGDILAIDKATIPSDIGLLDKAFPPKIKKELLKLKAEINTIEGDLNRTFFNLAFLSILESVSNTVKGGGFLRIVERNEPSSSVRRNFLDRCATMLCDVITTSNHFGKNDTIAAASLGDARNIVSEQKFNAVITSPPYPNRHDYTRIYALEMVFDFVSNNNELKAIRYKTLRSHVEARKQFDVSGYKEPKQLKSLVSQIKTNGTNNSHVPEMLEGYFEDMFLCLQQMKGHLKRRGKIALVVSNVRFSGINFPVDTLLSEIGEQAGLKPKAVWAARNRGNSAQQMRDYSRQTSRESIVIWEK